MIKNIGSKCSEKPTNNKRGKLLQWHWEYWWSISRHWIVNIVMSHLKDNSEDILDMNDVNTTYKNLLKNNERDNCKRYLKQFITENVPGVIFVRLLLVTKQRLSALIMDHTTKKQQRLFQYYFWSNQNDHERYKWKWGLEL